MYYYIKTYGFSADFPLIPVGAVVADRQNGNAVFLKISAFTRNTIAATPRNNLFDNDYFWFANRFNRRRRLYLLSKEGGPPRSGGGRFFTAQSAVYIGKMLRIFCGRQIAAPTKRERKELSPMNK